MAAGRAPQSARDLVRSLGLAAVDRDMETGAKLYSRDQAEAALAARPGQGNRSDLGKRKRAFTKAELAEVNSWARRAKRSLAKAAELGEGRAATALRTTAEQMERLVEAARRFPLYAMHPGVGNAHHRPYLVAPEMGRQLEYLAQNAHRQGERYPQLWDEMDALVAHLVKLVDLAASGRPYDLHG